MPLECSFYEHLGAIASEYNCLQSENATLRGQLTERHARQKSRFADTSTVVEIDAVSFDFEISNDQVNPESARSTITAKADKVQISSPKKADMSRSFSRWSFGSSRQLPSLPRSSDFGIQSQSQPFKPTLHAVWACTYNALPTVRLSKQRSGISREMSRSQISRGGDTLKDGGLHRHIMISPNSPFRMFWDLASLFILMFDIIMVPLVVFELQADPTLEAIDVACVIFWTFDLFVSCLSGYHKAGAIEMRLSNILLHYVKTWFCFDVSVVSLDWCMLILGANFAEVVGFFRIFRVSRFARVLRLFRLVRILKMPTMLEDVIENCRTEFLVTVLDVLKSLVIIAGVNHFVACGWYAVGKWGGSPSWIDRLDEDIVERDFKFRYATSLHWSLTQFTPASMEIYPRNFFERLYALGVLFFALVIFSSFVSTITNAMNHLRLINLEAHKQKDNLRRFIHDNKLSLELGFRIQAFARHHRAKGRLRVHMNDINVFKILPEALRLQTHWEVHVPILSWSPLFYNTAETFESYVLELCNSALDEESMLQGQEVFTCGAEASTMHFVVSGRLEYYFGHDDCPSDTLHGDQWVCEICLWVRWLYQGRLCVVKQSELLALNASTFRKLSTQHPELYEVFKIYAQAYFDYVQTQNETESQLVWFDIWNDHDACLEKAQRAFEICMATTPKSTDSSKMTWRPWHSLSVVHDIQRILHKRSNTH